MSLQTITIYNYIQWTMTWELKANCVPHAFSQYLIFLRFKPHYLKTNHCLLYIHEHLFLELQLTGVPQWQENTLCSPSQDVRVILWHMQLLHVQGAFEICMWMKYFSNSVYLNAHWALQLWFMCTFMHKMANSFRFALNNNIVTIAIWRASVSCLVQIQFITVIIFTTLDRMPILWQWNPTHKTGSRIKKHLLP